MKHWHLLHINPNLAEIFQNPPILAFRRNKNLRDIIGTKLIENGKVKRKFTNQPTTTLCCKQVAHTTFRSNQTNRIFQIYHDLNRKSMSFTCWNTPNARYNTRLRYTRRAIAHARLCTRLNHQRRAKKSTPCLIKKASRCAADRTSKTTFFIFHFL